MTTEGLTEYIMMQCSLREAFWVSSFSFWSTVLQCGAQLPIHTLNTGPCSQWCQFLTMSVCECGIAHRLSVAVLWMLYKIMCKPMHLCIRSRSYVCASAGWTRRFGRISVYTYAPPRCILAVPQDFYFRISVFLERSCWHVFDGVGLAGFKSMATAIFISLSNSFHFVFYCFPFLFIFSLAWYCGTGLFGQMGCQSLSPSPALPTFFKY